MGNAERTEHRKLCAHKRMRIEKRRGEEGTRDRERGRERGREGGREEEE